MSRYDGHGSVSLALFDQLAVICSPCQDMLWEIY